jgi:hypothetical protein
LGKRGQTAFAARLWDDNYDFLWKESESNGISMNTYLNHIIRDEKRRLKRSRRDITLPSPSSQNALQR